MYHGEMLHSTNLKIDSPYSKETLEDAEEIRLKMRNKTVQLNYGKLNSLYETFVPQQEPSVEQTYFLFPSTSNDCSESKEVTSDLPIPKIPKESKLLKIFEKMDLAIHDLRKRIDVTLLEDRKRNWMSDTKNEMLRNELEKCSSDSKDIQANLLKRIKIIENDFERSQAQKRENIKLEYQKLFNSRKATPTQYQKEVDELIEHVNQKTYAYADVRAQNQDLLMTISEPKNKLKTIKRGKIVNTKFDKSETSGTLLYVTLLPKNIAVKAKKV
ncbi:hypothetical protein Tco_0442952 [Tanacetum coccineum]